MHLLWAATPQALQTSPLCQAEKPVQSGGHLPCAHAQWLAPTVTLTQWHPPHRGSCPSACSEPEVQGGGPVSAGIPGAGGPGRARSSAAPSCVRGAFRARAWPDGRRGSSDLGPPRRSGGFPAPVCTWPRVPGLGFLLPPSHLPSSWSVPKADGGAGGGSWLSLVGIKYLILNVLSAAAKTLA